MPVLTIQNQELPIQTAELWGYLPARRDQFPLGLIGLFLNLVLYAPVSLRGASQALELILSSLLGPALAIPSANTGRLWLLRVALFELTRPKEKGDDWVWIADHTIQISSLKCLLIVGCRLGAWQQQRKPLEHQDLQVLALEPVETSSGELVCQQLKRTVEVTGVPRAIPARRDGPMQEAIREKFARLFDAAAGAGPGSLHESGGTAEVGQPRTAFMDDPLANDGSLVEPWRIQLEFAWLRDFDEPLYEWQVVMNVVETTLHFVRWEGYHREAHLELHARLIPFGGHPQSRQSRRAGIVSFVAEQSLGAKVGERLIGCE